MDSIKSISGGVLSKQDVENKRKKKELNRRKVKEQRKNRVKEHKMQSQPAQVDQETFSKIKKDKADAEANKEQMDQ